MAQQKITNCGDCAYAQKNGNQIWCPFHDVAVSSKLVCDDFLDEFQSPQWNALTGSLVGENNSKNSVAQFTAKDITAYVLSFIGIFISIACFLI